MKISKETFFEYINDGVKVMFDWHATDFIYDDGYEIFFFNAVYADKEGIHTHTEDDREYDEWYGCLSFDDISDDVFDLLLNNVTGYGSVERS